MVQMLLKVQGIAVNWQDEQVTKIKHLAVAVHCMRAYAVCQSSNAECKFQFNTLGVECCVSICVLAFELAQPPLPCMFCNDFSFNQPADL